MAVQALLIQGYPGSLKYTDNDIFAVNKILSSLKISTEIINFDSAIEVTKAICRIRDSSYSNDTLIVYYTGHGELNFGKLQLRFAYQNKYSYDLISINMIMEMLSYSQYTKIVYILDCCNAMSAQKAMEDLDKERFHLLYSSRTLERSWEIDELKMSAFSYFMCESLKVLSKDSDRNQVTLDVLDNTIRSMINQYNGTHNSNIPRSGAVGSKMDEVVLFHSFQDTDKELTLKINDYQQTFLSCIEKCRKSCVGRFSWCDSLFRHDIEMNKYAIPTVNPSRGDPVKLNDFYSEWLQSNDNYLALLADVGVGKSSACFYLVSLIIKSGMDYVPVLIPLYLWNEKIKETDIHSSIRNFSNEIFTSSEIDELIKSKRIIFLLDGFDEIGTESTLSSILFNFKMLAPFLRLGCKTLLTCRTHYFSEESQINDVLQGRVVGTDFAALLLSDEYSFLVGALQEFSESEIKEVIRLSVTSEDADKIWDDIRSIYDLRDLAKRAIILKMILKTLPELKNQSENENKKITASLLYKTYTYKLLKNELSNKRYQMDVIDIERFIEYIASLMWLNQTLRVNTYEFKDKITDFYSKQRDVISAPEKLDQYIYSGRVSSFFVRDKSDSYMFSHKSFFEYYFARYCLGSLEKECNLEIWGLKWFDKEIANFITDIIKTEQRKLSVMQLFKIANQETGYTSVILWNVLHILSLLDDCDVQEFLTEDTKNRLLERAKKEANCVMIRQYCRIIAKFIDRSCSEELIDKIIELVSIDPVQNEENNNTYFNYYSGKTAACNAFIKHLQVPSPKYDAKLHLYLLGDIAGVEYIEPLIEATQKWDSENYGIFSDSINNAIKAINMRINS